MKISSVQNENIKRVAGLRESKGRRAFSEFAVEGLREIRRAWEARWELLEVFVCSELLDDEGEKLLAALEAASPKRFEVSHPCFAKIAMRQDSGGLVAVFRFAERNLSRVKVPEVPFLLLLEGIEKPGNVGALIRSADGAGVDAILTMDCQADIFHPHVIRTSLGCCFSMPVVAGTREEMLAFCRRHKVTIYAALLSEDAVPFTDVSFDKRRALLLGSEDRGLSEFWRKNSDAKITIPMRGHADSLNVAAAGAVLLYASTTV
ncbi:MAG: RNA methyltransferase [Deltaproteobacteria bacterium]|nr:RNA methyltransferase [Deltaproteobacteria bacterium]